MTRSAPPRPPRPRRPVARAALALGLGAAAVLGMLTAGASALAAQHGTDRNDRASATHVAPAAPAVRASGAKRVVKHHYSLAASAFAPDMLDTSGGDYFNLWDPATLTDQSASQCFNAGLSLPVGATLVSVTVDFTAGSSVLYFEVSRQNLIKHTSVTLAELDSSVATTQAYTSQVLAFRPGTVVNMNGIAYSAGVCPVGDSTFSGLTITYTEPAR